MTFQVDELAEVKYLDIKGFDSIRDVLDHYHRNEIKLFCNLIINEKTMDKLDKLFIFIVNVENQNDSKRIKSYNDYTFFDDLTDVFFIMHILFGFNKQVREMASLSEDIFFLKASRDFYSFFIRMGESCFQFHLDMLKSLEGFINEIKKGSNRDGSQISNNLKNKTVRHE